ncbi:DUF1489 family protein [Sphingomonas sp.]
MLHITKVAYGAETLDDIRNWFAGDRVAYVTTRYLPKRATEIAGAGSLYWVHKHQLVARSPILGFSEAPGGRYRIEVDRLILVQARPKRAHQGWRYLEHKDAPPDLGDAGEAIAAMPTAMVGQLSELGLI